MTELCSKTVSNLWENPDYKEMMKQVSSNNMNNLWLDCDFRKKVSENSRKNMIIRNNDPKFKEMMKPICSKTGKENFTKKWQDLSFRKKMILISSEVGKKTGKINLSNYNNNKSYYLLKKVIDEGLELTEENYKKINGTGSGITSFKKSMGECLFIAKR